MEALFYILKVIICSGVLLGYYYLSLKDKTFHHYNRFYLLLSILISLLLPLIKLEDFTIEVNQNIYMLIDTVQNFSSPENTDTHENLYYTVAFSVLGVISVYFLGKFIYGTFKIHELKRKFERENIEGINFYRTDLTDAPFSYFKNLFWKNSITLNSEIGKKILKHEMVHIEQKHTFDKIILEIITSVFWFNPFYHLIKKEINLIHEYLADKKAVRQSDTKAFAQMLLASHFSGTELPATSPFLSSNLKKRLTMLQKSQTKFGYARRILALPVVFTVAFAYMVNAKNKEIAKTNLEIEKAVSQIKKDTIRPGYNKNESVQIYKKTNDEKKIAELGKKIEQKSKALKQLKPETKEFDKNVDEITQLSGEIAKITSSQDFQKSLSRIKINGKEMSTEEFFNSDQWKNQLKDLKNLKFEMPDFPEFEKGAVFVVPTPPNPPIPPRAPNAPTIRVFKSSDLKYPVYSKKAEREMRKARKLAEKAREAGEKARIQSEKARIENEKARGEGDKMRTSFSYDFSYSKPEVIRVTANSMVRNLDGSNFKASGVSKIDGNVSRIYINGKNAFDENIKVIIDGKESTRDDLKILKPDQIESISVKKSMESGKMEGEISINTKNKKDEL
ncbi:MAG: M56 family metallopeptidase [Candidatus Chryseobacterium colombiense]|nr:M56 family metallopeptidase [Chryseobacterium sp.]WEK70953.1 MAG: M56 family metallopeptidase [Chryseobacterium sp.]